MILIVNSNRRFLCQLKNKDFNQTTPNKYDMKGSLNYSESEHSLFIWKYTSIIKLLSKHTVGRWSSKLTQVIIWRIHILNPVRWRWCEAEFLAWSKTDYTVTMTFVYTSGFADEHHYDELRKEHFMRIKYQGSAFLHLTVPLWNDKSKSKLMKKCTSTWMCACAVRY